MYTTVLSILHRLSGLALTVAFFVLTEWLWAVAGGGERYRFLHDVLGSGVGIVVIGGAIAAFWYHLCTGIRHLVFDAGIGFEKAQARRSARIVIVAFLVLTVSSWIALATVVGRHA
jgi:succinate dehydrogenase / fumarate reductase, cytochrome b subunit